MRWPCARGHTQWFYFSIHNTRRNIPYKLSIINLVKGDSLYLDGMQPLVFSEKESAATGTGWVRSGESICYYQNNIKVGSTVQLEPGLTLGRLWVEPGLTVLAFRAFQRLKLKFDAAFKRWFQRPCIKRRNGQYYYTATFTLRFEHNHDTAHVAYCYPYTYTDLQRYLKAGPLHHEFFFFWEFLLFFCSLLRSSIFIVFFGRGVKVPSFRFIARTIYQPFSAQLDHK